MSKKIIISALIICACLVVALAFSYAYITDEAGHTCTDDNCAVCRVIAVCETVITTLTFAGASTAVMFGTFILVKQECQADHTGSFVPESPVCLCVKLTE